RRRGEGEAARSSPRLAEGRTDCLWQASRILPTPGSRGHCVKTEWLEAGPRPGRHPRRRGPSETPDRGTRGVYPVVGGRGGVVEDGECQARGLPPGRAVRLIRIAVDLRLNRTT